MNAVTVAALLACSWVVGCSASATDLSEPGLSGSALSKEGRSIAEATSQPIESDVTAAEQEQGPARSVSSNAQECVTALKTLVSDGSLSLTDYEQLALTKCGVDVRGGQTGAAPAGDKGSSEEANAPTSSIEPEAQACLAALKFSVSDGSLSLADYERLALSKCGVNVRGDGVPGTAGTPGSEPASDPAYVACANGVKAEVVAGTLPLGEYENELEKRCQFDASKTDKND